MASAEFCDWAASSLLAQLRSGRDPGIHPGHFAWDPLLGAIRAGVGPEDRQLVADLLSDDDTLMWGALLSRRFLDVPEFTERIVEAFSSETDLERQIGLLHHLAARPLDDDQFEAAIGWLEAHFQEFGAEQATKFGDETGPARLIGRIESDAPEYVGKRWLYMFSLHCLDGATCRSMLDKYADDADPRTATAARRSRARLVSTPGSQLADG